MGSNTAANLVAALRQHRLLEADQLTELTPKLQARFPDAKALAKELVRRSWLTPYQVKLLLQGRGKELLLGSYLLLDHIGQGGMGDVYKARNRNLGKVVALKVIRAERLQNGTALRRFQREVRAAARLSHPNVVLAYDADEVAGTQLLVMEYVEGKDLAKLIGEQQRPLPVEQACEIIRQAALGLQHAHEKGLVHRDIKPQNLLLTADGTTVKILDMGLARTVLATSNETMCATLTQDGAILGTVDYMAPEQSRQSHTVDIRADLYSLGCTFYFLLTGQPPFSGGTFTEKLFKHQLEEPRPVEQARPEVRPEVARIVRKLMAKKLEERYQTPGEAAAALGALLNSTRSPAPTTVKVQVPAALRTAVTEKMPVPAGLARPTIARRRWSRGLVAVVALLLLLGGGLVAWALLPRVSPAAASTAVAQRRESSFRPTIPGKIVPPEIRPLATNPVPETRPEVVKNPPPEKRVANPANEPLAILGEQREKAPVHALTVSADGQWLASSDDDSIRLWDTSSWRERPAPLRGHASTIRALAFSADGKLLASGSADKTIKLWDVATGRAVATLQGHTGIVRALAFTREGGTLASGANQDPNVRIWDVPGRKERFVWPGHEGGVHSLAFPADGRFLASAGADKLIRSWDMVGGQEPVVLKAHTADVISLAYAPDGKKLVSGTSGGLMRVWNPPDKNSRHLKGAKGQRSSITALAFSADGKQLISTGGKGLLVLWEPETEQLLREWTFAVPVHCAVLSPTGSFVAVGTDAGTIQVLRSAP